MKSDEKIITTNKEYENSGAIEAPFENMYPIFARPFMILDGISHCDIDINVFAGSLARATQTRILYTKRSERPGMPIYENILADSIKRIQDIYLNIIKIYIDKNTDESCLDVLFNLLVEEISETAEILYSNDYGNIKMHVDNIIRIMTKLKTFVIFHRNAK